MSKEYMTIGKALPGEPHLVCEFCGRESYLLNHEGYACDMLHGNVRCRGKLVKAETLPVRPKPAANYLKCEKCGRKADNLEMENKLCNWRFNEGSYCDGRLLTVD